MITHLFTYYDKIAMQCGPINHERNKATAIRSFINAFGEGPMKKFDADDFDLLYLGTYDHDKGEIDRFDVPENIPIALGGHFEKIAKEKEDGEVIRADQSTKTG